MFESLVYVAGGVLFLSLPLVPAWRELRHPTDATPLAVNQGNAADAKDAMRDALARLAAARLAGVAPAAMVANQLGQSAVAVVDAGRLNQQHDEQGKCVLVTGDGTLDDVFLRVPALWASTLTLSESAVFAGKLAAETEACVAPGAKFRVLQAPRIITGVGAEPAPTLRMTADAVPTGAEWLPLQQRFHAKSDFVVRAGTRAAGLIVAIGHGLVEAGATVDGAIKVGGTLLIEAGALVTGDIVADSVMIEDNCVITGSILANHHVRIGLNCHIGAPGGPATVAATNVLLSPNVTLHGAVLAHHQAEVIHAQ